MRPTVRRTVSQTVKTLTVNWTAIPPSAIMLACRTGAAPVNATPSATSVATPSSPPAQVTAANRAGRPIACRAGPSSTR